MTAPIHPEIPDPTKMVTQAIDKAEAHLNEKSDIKFFSLKDDIRRLEAQIAGGPIAIKAEVNSLHSLIISEMKRIEEIFTGRFSEINHRFNDRDTRQSALALAAKEAITKSEESIKEKITSLQALFDRTNSLMSEQVTDIKTRLDKGEGNKQGAIDLRAWIVAGVTILGGVIAFSTILLSKGP